MRDTWTARITAVIDADTLDGVVREEVTVLDTTVVVSAPVRVRLFGIDAYRKGTAQGDAGRAFVAALVGRDVAITVDPRHPREKFGRVLATVVADGVNVNQALVEKGLAVPWDGHGTRPAGAGREEEE